MSQREFLDKLKGSRELAERLSNGQLCLNCLGRNFAQVSTGLSNNKRGELVNRFLGKGKIKNDTCRVCDNIFQSLEHYKDMIIKQTRNIEFETFQIGTRLSSELIEKEKYHLERFDAKQCEPLKSEINRELGKLIEKQTNKKFNAKRPDLNILVNLETDKVEVSINSIFILSGYKKLVRNIPQTKWDMYKITVEGIIAKPFMKLTKGSGHSLHGAGREDRDARCLDFRPFVLEIKEPKKRKLPLKELKKEINKSKKVQVSDLSFSDKKKVRELKASKYDKTYRVMIQFEKTFQEPERLKTIIGTINQKTPSRVLHRRANLLRKRELKNIKWKRTNNKRLQLDIKGESGLYIKELVTGDDGRTSPSVAEKLGPVKVISLDVIKIHKNR